MFIYLVDRNGPCGYDEYDSFIVCADTEEEARTCHPGYDWEPVRRYLGDSWVSSPEDVTVTRIGKALRGVKKGVICASFNAG